MKIQRPTDREVFKAIGVVEKALVFSFGKKQCPEYNPECGNCMGQNLRGLLMWYDQLIDEGI